MNLTLPPALEARDQRRLLEQRALRLQLQLGIDQLDRGEFWTLPEDLEAAVLEIARRGQARLSQQRRAT